MEKLNPISIDVSAGITAVSALCAAAFVLWPDATIASSTRGCTGSTSTKRDRLRRSQSAGFSTV
jgi:hypothetical protein